MFAYINGVLEEVGEDEIIIDVGGMGYAITVPQSIIDRLPKAGEMIKIYTRLIVREDAMELYGFIDKQQKNLFTKLTTVSGIGPKGAMAILSTLNPDQLALSIVTGDVKMLTKAPGVGKKTAQRIILELKDKIDNELLINENADVQSMDMNGTLSEVVEALSVLGYGRPEIQSALKGIDTKDRDTATLIKMALKNLNNLK
ncbi:Holliday junction branch migration protein RuvA [Xylanivirga thermophila]|uniref:Holliday junction branch migration protein RuvA n=1 Tax=Xylanivirga thermophila TaxID=2496273 RepID=UPI00101C880A|nr:Holliday junction branch migration protein RuvA [Xylanivirga thermophila]